jgi:hypothetical protein
MAMRLENVGSQYLENFRATQGNAFDGSKTYKVTLPPRIPAARFWSFTARQSVALDALHAATFSTRRRPDLSDTRRQGERRRIDDGLLCPNQPAGIERGDCIQTDPKKGWWTIRRVSVICAILFPSRALNDEGPYTTRTPHSRDLLITAAPALAQWVHSRGKQPLLVHSKRSTS